jgi:hypothetical protein
MPEEAYRLWAVVPWNGQRVACRYLPDEQLLVYAGGPVSPRTPIVVELPPNESRLLAGDRWRTVLRSMGYTEITVEIRGG